MSTTSAQPNSKVEEFLNTLDEATTSDARALIDLMGRITSHAPDLWNVGTIGFDTYHYKYDTGREGDGHVIGFYPRKGKTTIYLMDGTARYADLLARLGPHTSTGYCIYIKRLSDVDQAVLGQLVQKSYDHIKSLGEVHEILWKN